MKAIKITQKANAEIQETSVPSLKDDYILVKVNCVALNPTDWKHIDNFDYLQGASIGCDFSGVVEAVGKAVDADWEKGDRIAGIVHGSDVYALESGSFGDYAVVKAGLHFKVADSITDEHAATFGVAVATVGQALYQALDLPLPGSLVKAEFPILIHGASSATGTVAVQFAKMSGAKVLATCSPRNFDLIKALGADEVFDYRDPGCAAQIREQANNKLCNVLDCIGGEDSAQICAQAMCSAGGQICTIIPRQEYPRGDTRVKTVLAYSVFGEPYKMGDAEVSALPEDYEFGKMFWRLAGQLINEGKIKAHPPKVGRGLEGVLQGLDDMRNGRVSGEKLVYRI